MVASGLFISIVVGWFMVSLALSGVGGPRSAPEYWAGDAAMLTVLRGRVVVHRSNGATLLVAANPSNVTRIDLGDRVETGEATSAMLTYFDGSTTEIEEKTDITIHRRERPIRDLGGISCIEQPGNRAVQERELPDATSGPAVAYVRSGWYRSSVAPDGTVSVQVDDAGSQIAPC